MNQAVSPGYQIAEWGRVTDSTPITPIKGDADNTDLWMVAAVGPRSFLTSDNDRGFLFLNTIEHGYVLTKSILPAELGPVVHQCGRQSRPARGGSDYP